LSFWYHAPPQSWCVLPQTHLRLSAPRRPPLGAREESHHGLTSAPACSRHDTSVLVHLARRTSLASVPRLIQDLVWTSSGEVSFDAPPRPSPTGPEGGARCSRLTEAGLAAVASLGARASSASTSPSCISPTTCLPGVACCSQVGARPSCGRRMAR